MSQKRRRESASRDGPADPGAALRKRRKYTEEDALLATIYEKLASEVSDDRIRAAKDLVARLEPSSNPAPEAIQTALTRLVRGLCSSRKAARFGFFIALTEILRRLHGAGGKGVDELIDFVEEKTRPESQSSRQEKRDHLLGLFFNYKAIVESSILWQPDVSLETWAKYLDHVFKLAKENVWLRDKCGVMLCEAITSLQTDKQRDEYVKPLLEHLTRSGLAKTAEGVAIWLTASTVCSDSVLPHGIWRHEDPLCTAERQGLAKILKGSSVDESANGSSDQKSASGFAMPTPSFAWDIVLRTVLGKLEDAEEKDDYDKVSNFTKFWLDVVDTNLFSSSSSHERKAWGFQIFAKVLSMAPQWALSSLFSPNLMKSLINQRKAADRHLHQAAVTPLKEMQTRASKEPETSIIFVVQLTSANGTIEFDRITKTKTVENIIGSADDKTMAKIVHYLDRLIRSPSVQDDQEANRERRLIADVLVSLAKGYSKDRLDPNAINQPGTWLRGYFELFIKYAYFIPNESEEAGAVPKPALHESTREVFRTRLLSCLTHFSSSKIDEQGWFPYVVVSTIRDMSKSSKTLDLVFQADHEVLKLVKHAHRTQGQLVSALKSSEDRKKPMYRALNLLWSQTILRVYNGDPDAASILEELGEIQPALTGSDAGEDSGSFELLLEVLLSFVAKPSALSRMLAEEVFTAFAAHATEGALQSMVDILDKKESIKGQEELFDQEASGEDVEEEESIDGEAASDVEMLDDDEGAESASEEESDDDEEEGDEGDEEDEDKDDEDENDEDENDEDENDEDENDEEEDDEVLEFESKLAKALGTAKLDPNAQEDESSDEDMDDEQMMALDDHLAKIFREQKGKDRDQKKERKDARETVINFKNRVLDLLQIYIKQQHANPLALILILPLLRLIRTTSSKQLSEKSFDLLKKYFESAKGKELPTPTAVDDVWLLLRGVHGEVAMADSKLHNTACTRASLFLARVLTATDTEAYRKIAGIYADTQEGWYADPKSNVQLSFFQEWLNWSNDMRKQRGVVQRQTAKSDDAEQQEKHKQQKPKKGKAKRK